MNERGRVTVALCRELSRGGRPHPGRAHETFVEGRLWKEGVVTTSFVFQIFVDIYVFHTKYNFIKEINTTHPHVQNESISFLFCNKSINESVIDCILDIQNPRYTEPSIYRTLDLADGPSQACSLCNTSEHLSKLLEGGGLSTLPIYLP